jgi:hypothetical protein
MRGVGLGIWEVSGLDGVDGGCDRDRGRSEGCSTASWRSRLGSGENRAVKTDLALG